MAFYDEDDSQFAPVTELLGAKAKLPSRAERIAEIQGLTAPPKPKRTLITEDVELDLSDFQKAKIRRECHGIFKQGRGRECICDRRTFRDARQEIEADKETLALVINAADGEILGTIEASAPSRRTCNGIPNLVRKLQKAIASKEGV